MYVFGPKSGLRHFRGNFTARLRKPPRGLVYSLNGKEHMNSAQCRGNRSSNKQEDGQSFNFNILGQSSQSPRAFVYPVKNWWMLIST